MKAVSNININEIEKKIGYTFKDKSLLIQAFTRTSYCNEHTGRQGIALQSNEVLEFFGDGVLSVAIISFMLKECTERYEYGIKTDLGEGDFSNIKSKLSDKQNLSRSMQQLGLQKYLKVGEGDGKLGIQNEPSVMEDLFESIVGAVYIDSDMSISAVICAVSCMLDMSVYTSKEKPLQSSKNALQEWCADKRRRLPAPRYETISEDGPDHKKTYVRACYIGDRLAGRGVGKNFKLADAAAADDALQALKAEESRNMTTNVGKTNVNKNDTVSSQSKQKNKKPADTQNKKAGSVQAQTEPKKPNSVQAQAEAKKAGSVQTQTEPKKVGSVQTQTEPKKAGSVQAQAEAKKASSAQTHGARLKAYISSMKLPSATYRDLGDTISDGKRESRVECRLRDEKVIGVGETRSEARENANALMIEALGIGKKKKAVSRSKTPAPNGRTVKSPTRQKPQIKLSPKGKPQAGRKKHM